MKIIIKALRKLGSLCTVLAFTVAVSTSVSCCHYWFAQPEEPNELREYTKK